MACEWTHHLSYRPGLIAVYLGPNKTTVENIMTTKEFGVNLLCYLNCKHSRYKQKY